VLPFDQREGLVKLHVTGDVPGSDQADAVGAPMPIVA
jgi:hypothetical protein